MTHATHRWLGVWVVVICAGSAMADTKADFEGIYGPQVRKAMASPNKRDAVAMADKLLVAAKELQGSPDLRVMILEKAIELGLQAPAGYDTVDHAVEMLLAVAPERRGEWQNKRLQILLGRFQAARGDERQQTGDEYLAYLIAVADEEVEAGQVDQGIARYRQAIETAKKFNAATAVDLGAKIRHAEARKDLVRQELALREKLKATPTDAATREKLVRLLVTDMDAPGRAVGVLNEDLVEATRTYVPLATKEIDQVDEKIAVELGRWYEGMLPTASPFGVPVVLTRARAYYRRYLEVHTAKDADGLKGSMSLQRIDAEARKRGVAWPKEKLTFSDPKVADAVRRAGKYLLSIQKADGSWPEMTTWINGTSVPIHGVGVTALVTCALVESGADPKSPGVSKALRWLADRQTTKTFCLSWRCTAIASLDGVARTRMLGRLRDDAKRLMAAGPNGCFRGDVTGPVARTNREGWDASSSQHAAQGLWAASRVGLIVGTGTWNAILKHWQTCQKDDGGWQRGFAWPTSPGPTDTDTLAGLAACYAALQASAPNAEAAKRNAANCNPIKRGHAWLDRNFPRNKGDLDCHYLYLLSRVGLASGRPMFGTTNWADWGTQWLFERMQKPHLPKTCPTCNRTFDPGAQQCWNCKIDLPTPSMPPDATVNWNNNAWDTARAILFFVNAERARNP